MVDQFSVSGDGQRQFKKFIKRAPKAFNKVSAGVLNTMAFSSREGMQDTLRKDFTIRTPALLKRGLRVETAKHTQSLDNQKSRVGSIITPRHDAWEAVDQGEQTRATMFTDAGRGGSNAGRARKEAKAGADRTSMKDFTLKGSGDSRIILYLQAIQRDKQRRRKAFYLPQKYRGLRKGVYKFKGGRVGTLKHGGRKYKKTLVGAKIVRISAPGSKFRPTKTDWNKRTIKRVVNERSIKQAWVNNMNRELGKLKRSVK